MPKEKIVTASLLISKNLLLIARRNSGSLAGYWEFPGGKLEEGETPEACLTREMYEEFDIEVEVQDLYCESVYAYPAGTIKLIAYWAKLLCGEVKLTVHDQIAWVRPHELTEYRFAPADIPIAQRLRREYNAF